MNRDAEQTQTRPHLDRTDGRGLSPMIVAGGQGILLASALSDFPTPCMSKRAAATRATMGQPATILCSSANSAPGTRSRLSPLTRSRQTVSDGPGGGGGGALRGAALRTAFLAAFFAEAFLVLFLADAFFAYDFLPAAFFIGLFLATPLRAVFLAAPFFTAFLAELFFAAVFFPAFLAVAFTMFNIPFADVAD
jgi:hypothetical protein